MSMISRRLVAVGFTIILLFSMLGALYRINSARVSLWPLTHGSCYDPSTLSITKTYQSDEPEGRLSLPYVRKNIAVASIFPHHFDVYLTIVWTLERLLHNVKGTQVRVFANPFNYGFQSIVDRLSLYHGQLSNPDSLVSWVNSTEDPQIDTVILGTCEVDLPHWHTDLLAAWEARSSAQKFTVVCVVHNVKDTNWQSHIPDWSRRNSIRILPIGEHVKQAFRHIFDERADSVSSEVYTAGYEYIPIDVHIPVLDISNLPAKHANRTLSKAVIQGSFTAARRDYPNFFADLVKTLHDDPAVWGYLPLGDRNSFVPDLHSTDPPFQVALVGSGSLDIPRELANIITVHRDLPYEDFYQLVADMDIVVPAFAELGYFEDQASSTIALAVELDVPILATRRMRHAYGYIDDDRAVVTRPAAMREIHALKALRTGDLSSFFSHNLTQSGYTLAELNPLRRAVEDMLQKGWYRDPQLVREYKEMIWRHNELVIKRLLRAS